MCTTRMMNVGCNSAWRDGSSRGCGKQELKQHAVSSTSLCSNNVLPRALAADHMHMQLSVAVASQPLVSTNFTFFDCAFHTL